MLQTQLSTCTSLGADLRALRKARGLTLQDMGDPDLLSFAAEADNASDNEDHDRPDEDLPDEDIIEADVVVDPDSRDDPNA